MNIAVIGSRTFNDYELFKSKLNEILQYIQDKNITIVSGGAIGADKLAEQYADEKGYRKLIFLPDWKKYGKSA